ncbi:MAG: polysaccharide deacetylase family protein [Deltaproteobacteria bacterium]|nr:polysaccharide deacetylase family protein [Deltaproteobacteria bacterium]
MRVAVLSIDCDGPSHYAAIHGLEPPASRDASFLSSILRRVNWFFEFFGVKGTIFAIGRDIEEDDAYASVLQRFAERGHEVASHSYSHNYSLARWSEQAIEDDIARSVEVFEKKLGLRPLGFRAPGYVLSDGLLRALRRLGFEYDSSVFPCPAYQLTKTAVIAAKKALAALGRGKASASVVDDWRVSLAPRAPYFPAEHGRLYQDAGRKDGLIELPIAVTPRLRLPMIGTMFSFAGRWGSGLLTRSVVGQPFVMLEFHAIDFADPKQDGLAWLEGFQPDLRRARRLRERAFYEVMFTLLGEGYRFMTAREAANLLRNHQRANEVNAAGE